MLNLTDKKYSKEEVLEFLNRTPLKGVIISKDSINMEFVKNIQGMNIPVYIEVEDRLTVVK